MSAASHDRQPCPGPAGGCAEFAFFSPESELFVQSSGRLRPGGNSAAALAERALKSAALEGATNAVVVGALPFEVGDEPSLSLARDCLRGAPARAVALQHEPVSDLLALGTALERPSRSDYQQAVRRALAAIHVGQLDKVVLARAVDYALVQRPCRGALLARLLRGSANAHVFVCPVGPSSAEGRSLLGASPELLVSKRGRRVRSHPLAGSAPRSPDPQQDRANAEALLRCEKNRREHAFAVEAVASALAPLCHELHAPAAPTLVATPKVWHLGTPVRGTLRDRDVSSLALAEVLHPTPAICGTPRMLARACIRELEGFERGFYAGAVGYTDSAGDGEWVVAIRCGELADDRLRLYAGAGIVAGADPNLELEETSVKLSTMLDALGLTRWEEVA